MPFIPYALARPALFALAPEAAHDLTLKAMERLQHSPLCWAWRSAMVQDPVELAGLRFPNRVGLAAGLDKNARCVDGFAAMGFGFVEAGTVTPKAQSGNPKPRMFRIPQAQALINRMGFNNEGLDIFLRNVGRAGLRAQGHILGLNIGKNAATPMDRAADDYLLGLDSVYPHADYVAVNISSPNTQNLRALQTDAALDALLGAIAARRMDLAKQHDRRVPIFVKIAPDLDAQQIGWIARSLQRHGMDGVIATNTTTAREAVAHLPDGAETGGLSGAPLLAASNQVVKLLRQALGAGYPIIGVGGIMSASDAQSKIDAGADLVQIYTGLIYQGPVLVGQIAKAFKAMARPRPD